MYYSFHVKDVFDMAKNSKNVIFIKYTENDSSVDKKFVLVDFIEKNDEQTFEKKVELYLKDIEKPEENVMKLDIRNVQNFLLTSNKIDNKGN